ncbi:SDR family NAD(P)-dependent oxidoreductase [Arthrobacter sp. JZ12]|uniref:oxidoreductase n=1 Tax=Arthrobacter sp. JZ12 TaxID=2654190 RepID=UPI002B49B2CE|nr:oxidoreductase [Arthrobacter sp. JZ12]WRH25205.1 SDR family NAD(P)-dependent oxidoreductase [Arthrobacter sp. JZ12]
MNPQPTDSPQDGGLEGRTAVVTGANSGIGLQTVIGLARRGASVVLACRDQERGAAALQTARKASGSDRLELRSLDLANLASIRGFARDWTGALDILVNNAGVMATPLRHTVDGFEQQFGINHLGHFALTGLLLGALRSSPSGRVVTVSSLAHRRGRIDFSDLNAHGRYRSWKAYGQSKLANLLFTMELDRRLRAAGWPLIACAAHPGLSTTNLTNGVRGAAVLDLLGGAIRVMGQSDADGAKPILLAATGAQVRGGDYYGPDGAGETRGNPVLVAPAPAVLDPVTAARLWSASEELTGVRYQDLPAAP